MDIRDKCWTNVYVCENICSILIAGFLEDLGTILTLGPNSRMVARTSLLLAPSCFFIKFHSPICYFWQNFENAENGKKTLLSLGAKFLTFSIFASEMTAKTVFKLAEFKFIIKIEVERFYETLDAILRLFLVKLQKLWKIVLNIRYFLVQILNIFDFPLYGG